MIITMMKIKKSRLNYYDFNIDLQIKKSCRLQDFFIGGVSINKLNPFYAASNRS